jgi:chromate reductase, NAD(P)H dehydrogenase (quinone)
LKHDKHQKGTGLLSCQVLIYHRLKKIFILPGSLRERSSSHLLIDEIVSRLRTRATCQVYDGTGALPHFNDQPETPEQVRLFKEEIRGSDAVLICTPEYAFGVPGTLKNALDWTVGSGEFVGKPVVLITASSDGRRGHQALQDILTAISAELHPETTVLIPGIRSRFDGAGKLKDGELRQVLDTLCQSIIERLYN